MAKCDGQGDIRGEVSEVINVRNFLHTWVEILPNTEYGPRCSDSFHQYLSQEIDMSNEMIQELGEVCGESTLTCPGEPENRISLLKGVPEEVQLISTGLQKEELEKRQKSQNYGRFISRQMKYHQFRAPLVHQGLQKKVDPETSVVLPEVLLRVRICRQFVDKSKLYPSQEFDVLGSQFLTSLRDNIKCLTDYVGVNECSDLPDSSKVVRAKDLFKSSFFYVEGTFYNDMRDPMCRDYSKSIVDWAADPSRGIGPFNTRNMEDVTFLDLNIRLGQPYVYIHLGSCEHLMVFSEIRLLHPDDCQQTQEYPVEIGSSIEKTNYCRACHMQVSKWVVRGSALTPCDPCFLCDTCLQCLHYDTEGHKIGDFRLYTYSGHKDISNFVQPLL